MYEQATIKNTKIQDMAESLQKQNWEYEVAPIALLSAKF